MGLDTSHNCWHGPYSAFMRWRERIAQLAGLPPLREMDGYVVGGRSWDSVEIGPGLRALLTHSDCDGIIMPEEAAPMADELQALMQEKMSARALYDDIRPATERFIWGLRDAVIRGENVEFH